jgi:hypothetical protein
MTMAVDTFHSNLLDVEVQMVPKTGTAIQTYLKQKRKETY